MPEKAAVTSPEQERPQTPAERGADQGREIGARADGRAQAAEAVKAAPNVSRKIDEFKKNPPTASFREKHAETDAARKGKEAKVNVRTSLNVRDEGGRIVGVLKPGDAVKFTGESTKDGRFVGIERKDGKKAFVAAKFLTESGTAAPAAPSAPTGTEAKAETAPAQGAAETASGKIEKTKEPITVDVLNRKAQFEGEYRTVDGKPVPVKGKLTVDNYAYEGTFQDGAADGNGTVTFDGQKVGGTFRKWHVMEGKGSVDGKAGEFKYATETQNGKEVRTMTFVGADANYRFDPKSAKYVPQGAPKAA